MTMNTNKNTLLYRKSIPYTGFRKHWWVNKCNFKRKYKVRGKTYKHFAIRRK